MALGSSRWTLISESPHSWERDGLEYIRLHLPDVSPYRAWGLFEFIGLDGSIGEVDLLVLAEGGLFLVELKGWPELTRGDSATWYRERTGAPIVLDNPLFATERKVKRLVALLKQQEPFKSGKVQLPYIESLVFLSHPDVQCKLEDRARFHVCLRDRQEGDPNGKRRGIIAALERRDCAGLDPDKVPRNLREVERGLAKALDAIGIRPRTAMKRVGDYNLGSLIAETPFFQDWVASHVKLDSNKRRIRIYLASQSASKAERERVVKAADREFRILTDAEHPNILPVETQTEHELGPALIFKYDPAEIRLDHYLGAHGKELSSSVRLQLVRQLADALRYAHSKKLIHRILTPESVLVNSDDPDNPRLRLLNWQAGFRVRDGKTTVGLTLHPGSSAEDFIDDQLRVFLAPEAFTSSEKSAYKLDVFSLGTLIYYIFAGSAPAQDPGELLSLITAGERKGLSLAGAIDGVPELLDELIRECTQPDVTLRLDSIEEVFPYLDLLALEFQRPTDEDTEISPLDAEKDDMLSGNLRVLGTLGSGSTAKTILVERDGQKYALKVASSPELSYRIAEESLVLKDLRHPNIVQFHQLLDFGPLKAILMESVGTTSLGHRLRSDGRLSLDLLHRFGSQLLDALRYLEDEGIAHRDIKPDNMGIAPRGSREALRLILYDFSLSGASLSNIRAGTSAYLDPFLELRKPRQWDLAAERFTVAMSLYEMATGTLARWGDGESLPAALDCEVTIEKELFPRAAAEELARYFARALRRDPTKRFDNALEMKQAWERIFERIESRTSSVGDSESFLDELDLDALTPESELAALKLPARILEVLDQENILTVQQLINLSPSRFRIRRGTGYRTSRELYRLALKLQNRFGDTKLFVSGTSIPLTEDDEDDQTEFAGIDPIYHQVSKSLTREKGEKLRKALLDYFGIETEAYPHVPSTSWPSMSSICNQHHLERKDFEENLGRVRKRFAQKYPSITRLRTELADTLKNGVDISPLEELVGLILGRRGSAQGDAEAKRRTRTVLRIAIEAERDLNTPRFYDERVGTGNQEKIAIVASEEEALDRAVWVESLGKEADTLVADEAVITLSEAAAALRRIPGPEGVDDIRLVRLAVAFSAKASLSPGRLEFYARGMSALKSLKLARGAVMGLKEFSAEELSRRIRARYPDAEPLPPRPELDELLISAELPVDYRPATGEKTERYVFRSSESSQASSFTRFQTKYAPTLGQEVSTRIAQARDFEQKLNFGSSKKSVGKNGGF